MKGVVAVGGRPDVEAKKDIRVSMTSAPSVPSAPSQPVAVAPSVPAVQPTVAAQPAPARMMIISCTRCSAPLSPSQEDLIVTCRYCGFQCSLFEKTFDRLNSALTVRK